MPTSEPIGSLQPDAFLATGRWDRPALTAVLGAAAAQYRAGRPALDRIARLGTAASVAVVTGQQPAVGGGPLYTLVKTAHAIATAQALDGRGVAVFWCASEDHDLGEAGHADLITRDGARHRFTGGLGTGRASLRFRPARSWWDALLDHCRRHLGGGPGTAWLEGQRPDGDEGMGAWTCRLMAALFARHGLVCVEGHLLRPLWNTPLRRAIDAWPARELAELRQRLLADGHPDAFGPLDQPPLFADRAQGRSALTPAEAAALLAGESPVISPGAALRPILQQAALPALAYIGGPGELAYHRFIAPLYHALAVPAPGLVPRCSLTLVPPWVERGAARWGVAVAELAGSPLASPQPCCSTELAALDAAIDGVERASDAPDLRPRLEAGAARLRRERGRLAASLARAERKRLERPAWGALDGWLHPGGERQERVLSLFQAVWDFGPGIADVLVSAASRTPAGGHAYLSLA